MFRKVLKTESGYSLIEVMVSIMLLSIAILPMVGMFDMGLNSATRGSNYDKARALANLKMEEAKSLPYAAVRDTFPITGYAPSTSAGYSDTGFISQTGPTAADFTKFQYRVQKQYMAKMPLAPGSSSAAFGKCDSVTPSTCAAGTDPIRLTVTIQWGSGNSYTIFGFVT